jgi:hypothetical protein
MSDARRREAKIARLDIRMVAIPRVRVAFVTRRKPAATWTAAKNL